MTRQNDYLLSALDAISKTANIEGDPVVSRWTDATESEPERDERRGILASLKVRGWLSDKGSMGYPWLITASGRDALTRLNGL